VGVCVCEGPFAEGSVGGSVEGEYGRGVLGGVLGASYTYNEMVLTGSFCGLPVSEHAGLHLCER
jgi:hypothetical protein